MRTIRLSRKNHVLYIGDSSTDIDTLAYVTVIYRATHVVDCGDGWYNVHNGHTISGFVTEVENVEERW